MHATTGDSRARRWVLGGAGVIAAGVLLYVSASMNYRFGYSLGKTPADGELYGQASVAADICKALAPFFFFSAWRCYGPRWWNRHWSAAIAAFVVWLVTTGYALTGALGHSLLNRMTVTGERQLASEQHSDLRTSLKQSEERLGFIPKTRPYHAVQAEIEANKAKNLLLWNWSSECTEPNGRAQREFCAGHLKLGSELASAREADKLRQEITEIKSQLSKVTGQDVMGESDPQAGTIAKVFNFHRSTVQFGFALMIVGLLEAGSGLLPYVALSYLFGFGPSKSQIIDGTATDITPAPAEGEAAPGLSPPAQPATGLQIPAPSRLPLPGALQSLEEIGFPIHQRPPRTRDKLPPREAAERFVVWLQAFDLTRESFTDEEITSLYAEFCKADDRAPTADNLVKGDLKTLRAVQWSKPRQTGEDGKLKRSARWVISRGRYPPQSSNPKQEGAKVLALPRPLAVPAREPEPIRRAA